MGIHSSWYMVEVASSLAKGERRVVERLSQKLELERDHAGVLSVRDSEGRTLPVDEVADMILVWVGDEEPDFTVGPFVETRDSGWAPVRWHRSRPIASTVVNVMRDVADNAHFEPVHGLFAAETRLAPEGPRLRVAHRGVIDLRRFGGPPLRARLRLEGHLHGLGLLAYRTTLKLGVRIRNLVLSAATPIDDHHVQMFAGVTIRRFPIVARPLQRRMCESLAVDYERDAEHWESTVGRYQPPVLSDEEQALYGVYEAWAAQFAAD